METVLILTLVCGGTALLAVFIAIVALYCRYSQAKNSVDSKQKDNLSFQNVDLESQEFEALRSDCEILLDNLNLSPDLSGSCSLKTNLRKKDSSFYDPSLNLETTVTKKVVFAWGSTENGQLGIGRIEEEPFNRPTKLDFTARIKSISCGSSHTLFLLDDGSLWSCGSNNHGQLGHDNSCSRPNKVEGLGHDEIVAFSCGSTHNIAVNHRGSVFTWGSDYYGQLGLETKQSVKIIPRPANVKSLIGQIIKQVAAGEFHSIVLTLTGDIYTCGLNTNGQLGLGHDQKSNQTKFRLVETLVGFPCALITAGGHHSFALSVSGSVIGWGKNTYGQLGISSDTDNQWEPTELPTLTSLEVRYVTAGLDHTAFLTKDGGVFTCGSGKFGQLGHGSTSNQVLPRKILEFGKVVTQIACGRFHTLCWIQDRLYSFGNNSNGQLGLGHLDRLKDSPFHIKDLPHVVDSIFAGGDHTVVLVEGLIAPFTYDNPNGLISKSENNLVRIRDYRQFERQNQLLKITSEIMSQICATSDGSIKLLEIVFTSPAVWNASFLDLKERNTNINLGIDLDEAENILSRLGSITSQKLKDTITKLLCVDFLPRLEKTLHHMEMSRVYLLVPLVPNFYSGNNVELPILYADRLLSSPTKNILTVTLSLYSSPMEQILRVISVYKRTILSILERHESNQNETLKDYSLGTCLCFLNLLTNLNRIQGRLSYHTFCIPQLSSKVDIALDYCKWLFRETQSGIFFCAFPFVFDAPAKSILLETDQIIQMKGAMQKAAASQIISNLLTSDDADPLQAQFLLLHVSRENLIQDVVTQIVTLSTHDLKKPLKINFIGEEAIDIGGVKKEFFLLLIREIMDPKYGMFKNFEESRLMWFKADTFEEDVMYLVVGIICGLAIYNSTIINLPFPTALYKKLLKQTVDLMDLKELSLSEGRSLEQVMEYKESDFEETFSLNFEISQEEFGEVKTVSLKPNGSNVPVTLENKGEFVDLYVSYLFNVSCAKQFQAFQDGFLRVCGSTVLELFHAQELQAMVTGNEDYDWGELEQNCSYKEDYHEDDRTVKMFWEVFHSLTLPQKKQFLLFLTGSDRIPILGMKTLKLIIQPTNDDRQLPVAHTCFNLIDLPRYKTKERLKYKLLQAIEHNEGFELA